MFVTFTDRDGRELETVDGVAEVQMSGTQRLNVKVTKQGDMVIVCDAYSTCLEELEGDGAGAYLIIRPFTQAGRDAGMPVGIRRVGA